MNKGYIIKEAYLTYFIDSKHVYKHTQVLIIKTYDLENNEFDTPICENLEILIDTSKYSIGHRSGCLVSDIPFKTTQFKFYYVDKNNIISVICFREKASFYFNKSNIDD